MSNSNARSEAKKLISQIENLAHQVAVKLDGGSMADMMSAASELVKNSASFTFVLGSLYQEEKVAPQQSTTSKKKNPNMARTNYHNKRDSRGKFIKA